jgi:hypothetical protein
METGATPVLRRCGRRTLKFHCLDATQAGDFEMETGAATFLRCKVEAGDWSLLSGSPAKYAKRMAKVA